MKFSYKYKFTFTVGIIIILFSSMLARVLEKIFNPDILPGFIYENFIGFYLGYYISFTIIGIIICFCSFVLYRDMKHKSTQ